MTLWNELCVVTFRLSIQLPSSLLEGQRRNGNGRRDLARTLLLLLVCIVAVTSLTSLTILFVSGTAPVKYFSECCSWGNGEIPGIMIDHNFAVVIDAGSSGSRVFVYHWPKHDGDPSHLLKIDQLFDANGAAVVKKVEPGLSAFADHPQDAYAYMKPLLNFAESHIPSSKQEDTLLYVLATAGMRLLPIDTQHAIMEHLQLMIKSEYNFYLPESSVEVISGKLEGTSAWLCNVLPGVYACTYELWYAEHNQECFTHELVSVICYTTKPLTQIIMEFVFTVQPSIPYYIHFQESTVG